MQTSFFQDNEDLDQFQDHNLGNASFREYPQAMGHEQASALLCTLQATIPWQQTTIRMAGKMIEVPRLQCWMGDRQSRYGYSGMRLLPVAWQADVLTIRHRVQELAGTDFNSVLLNYYRNGQDSVAWHADDEPELGPDPVIASLSLGAERFFQLKSKYKGASEKYRILLRHGSVLVMGKGMQINWLHQLPKVQGLDLPRINLTFRQIL